MTSPVSAVEAIERFERAVAANGYRTCDDQTEAEYRAAKAEVLALARQAEALQRENGEKDARIAALEKALAPLAHLANNYDGAGPSDAVFAKGCVYVNDLRRARALLGGSDAQPL